MVHLISYRLKICIKKIKDISVHSAVNDCTLKIFSITKNACNFCDDFRDTFVGKASLMLIRKGD